MGAVTLGLNSQSELSTLNHSLVDGAGAGRWQIRYKIWLHGGGDTYSRPVVRTVMGVHPALGTIPVTAYTSSRISNVSLVHG